MKKTFVFTALLIATVSAPAEEKLVRPTPEQAVWQDLELGLFITYDLPVFKPGWDHRQYEQRPEPGLFNPRKLDTDRWMEAAKAMGAKYAVLVAKHGSGFLCWQSDLYPYGMKQSPYKSLQRSGGLNSLDRQRGRSGALSLLGHRARRSRLPRSGDSGWLEMVAGRVRCAAPPGSLAVGTRHREPPLFR